MKVSSHYRALPDAESARRGDGLIAWLRDYAERRVNSRLMDERRTIPPYVALDMGNQGFLGIQVEPEYGGLGLRNREVARLLEQTAAIDLALGTWLLVCLFPGVRPIATFAGDAFKKEILPQLASGRVLAGFAQTEPGAGTHFAAMTTRARSLPRGGWSLSGDKVWIGNATWAGILTVMAQAVDEAGRRRGLVALAVRTDQPGVQLGRELLSMGMRGVVQSEVSFREVEVAPEQVLSPPERGLEVGVDSMSWSRFAIAATCVGSMKRCAQLMLRFAARRSIATGRLLEHPVARGYVGETVAMVSVAEALLYGLARALDEGREVPVDYFAVTKTLCAEFLWSSADRLVQVLGSRGYDEANGAPQLLRDARVTRIFEGTSEALIAFTGSQALIPTSDLYALLREELGAPRIADELEETAQLLRGRGRESSRAWQCALAGWSGAFALAHAAVAREHERAPSDSLARAAAWSRQRLDEARARASGASADERALLDAASAEGAVAAYADSIGDVEQQLPGARDELDPLLRR